MRKWKSFLLWTAAAWCAAQGAAAANAVQSATNRPVLGVGDATPYLWYDASVAPTGTLSLKAWKKSGGHATNVMIAGTWSCWTGRHEMVRTDGDLWRLDTRELGARLGNHEFKFIVNGTWEEGANRGLPIDLNGEIHAAPSQILQAAVEDWRMIRVFFRDRLPEGIHPTATLDPPVPVVWTEVVTEMEDARVSGYVFSRGVVTFLFDPAVYGLDVTTNDKVAVAGNFTGWDGSGKGGKWALKPPKAEKGESVWELSAQLDGMRLPAGEKEMVFKFVVNGTRWLPPPHGAPNRAMDGKGNANLRLDLMRTGGAEIRVHTGEDLDITRNYTLRLDGVEAKPLGVQTTPGGIFDRISSDKPLGAVVDREAGTTTYRLFAPRATDVWLCFFRRAEAVTWKPAFKRFRADEEYRMRKAGREGVWEITMNGVDFGRYYGFRVAGPDGNGEGFDPYHVIGDPYGRAAATANGLTLLVDPDATNEWFAGWTDGDWKTPAPQDMIIYECHVRGQTVHPSGGIARGKRGTYEGLIESLKGDTGLGHAKAMGANTIELLPIAEASESDDSYNWGYATVYYFAPESAYASNPTNGAAYYEFKSLVDALHGAGLAVILDVVYNHTGGPNIFGLIDKKASFRLLPDLSYSNHSGCGNDVRTESPMMRRMLIDNILYYMREFHVDGFRFDLAELVDMFTMKEIIKAAREVNPNVALIAEPWSPGRGENKSMLTGTGWAAWNNDFRYAAKDFARGWGNRDWLRGGILGSVSGWAQNPLQPINYLESHDDMAFADELSEKPNHDGRNPTEKEAALNRLAATILFTSLGRPMIYEGQEFLRSKLGINNTYNRGDAVNAIRWTDRDRPLAKETMEYYRGLMHLRASDEGAAFRVARRPPAGYYRWLLPADPKRIGYVVNVPELHAGRGFIVLLNADDKARRFAMTFPGDSAWRLVGNGLEVDLNGVAGGTSSGGAAKGKVSEWAAGSSGEVTLPAWGALIFMNGFGK